jgi:signal peptidase II
MSKSLRTGIFCLLTLAFIGCDRVTKDLAKENLADRGTISYLHDTFRLQYVENTGAALNLGDKLSKTASFWLLSMIPLMFLLVLVIYLVKNVQNLDNKKLLCFALVLSGGLGNIIDRIVFDRHVTDFMNLGINHIRTGIFNFADVCVSAGVAGLAILYGTRKPGPGSSYYQSSRKEV